MLMAPTNLVAQFDRVDAYWSPKVIGQVNNQYLKVAKMKGSFTWHAHDDEDELFYVVRGRMRIEFEAGAVDLGEGDFYVVPRGVRHLPVAEEECWVMLIETVTTKHTGNTESELTRSLAEQLS